MSDGGESEAWTRRDGGRQRACGAAGDGACPWTVSEAAWKPEL